MGKTGKHGENIGILVEEDGKNIQLSTKMARFLQTVIPIFLHFPPSFLWHVAQYTPPTTPRPTKKVVLGAFHAMLYPFFNKASDNSHSRTHFPPFSPIFPHFSSSMLLNTPPNPPEGQRKVVVWAFHAMLSPLFPQNIGELSVRPTFPHFSYSGLFRRHYLLISGSG